LKFGTCARWVRLSLVLLSPARSRLCLAAVIAELQAAGVTSLRAITAALNERGIPTAAGSGQWQAAQVRRVLGRLATLVKFNMGGDMRPTEKTLGVGRSSVYRAL
jgi:hypothetical protein